MIQRLRQRRRFRREAIERADGRKRSRSFFDLVQMILVLVMLLLFWQQLSDGAASCIVRMSGH